ncbi:GNAT family N-acetyltransferase [Exiguobacterium qingdaonense]|uniref:GNAT family N-acetyltransferase n=1 Tax=Exiguobacterium qingdaonense TaxID=2751251 RepID=UPI001BE96223|nr:GNAT family N-acetyltransferase [Exiguobacterium qingdaonense]
MTRDKATVSDYVSHLEACDHLFPTKLSERVDLHTYATKLHERATSFELWQDDVLVGLLAAYMDQEVAFISHICVLPEAPRGSGQKLLNELIAEVRKAGKRGIRLNVEATNGRARAFYLRQGFMDVGHIGGDIVMEHFIEGKRSAKERKNELY